MSKSISERTQNRLDALRAEGRDCRGSGGVCLSRATLKHIFEDGTELRLCARHHAKSTFDSTGRVLYANGTVVNVVCF